MDFVYKHHSGGPVGLVFYPDKELRKEANVAIAKETTRGLRIAKEKTSAKIDQIVALAMAFVEVTRGAGSFFSGCDLS